MNKWTINGRTFQYGDPIYRVGCGGTENPFRFEGKHYLYVWNIKDKNHYYYCFEDDMYIGDKQMNQMMDRAILMFRK